MVNDIEECGPYEKIEYSRKFFERFHREARILFDNYRSEDFNLRPMGQQISMAATPRYFAVLWSNVQILLPSIYQKAPNAYVERRFLDKDDVAKTASEILEKVLDIAIAETNFDDAVKDAVKSRLICGQGTVWLRHAPQIFRDNEGKVSDIVDKIEVDHVTWEDFLCTPTDRWSNVTWVARRVFLTRKGFKTQFKKDPEDYLSSGENADKMNAKSSNERRIHKDMYGVWEFWDKEKRKVYFVADGSGEIIQERDDYLMLENFFPCPKPFFATSTPNTIIPVPDYKEYLTQAEEINELTRRIGLITAAVSPKGFYDASIGDLARLFTEADDTQLIPVQNYMDLMTKGGLASCIQWLPLDAFIQTLQTLYECRDKSQQSMDLVTGISDIIRGSGDASETATAQNIKSQYASIRLKSMQDDCFSFVRSIVAIMGEIIVKHFNEQSLMQMSNYEYEEDANPEMFQKAYQFMQDYHNVKFRVNIETDSIMVNDEAKEQDARTNFLGMVTGIIQQMFQIPAPAQPTMVPLMGEFLMFVVRSFKVGRELEQSIENSLGQAMEQIQQAAQQQAQQAQDQSQQPHQQGGVQTVINQDAPQPIPNAKDLLQANTKTQDQMFETLREKIKMDKETFTETEGQYGKLWTNLEINNAMNAIIKTNKESDLQEIRMLSSQQQSQDQSQQVANVQQ